MIENGREPLPHADPEGEGSSQTITDGEETIENGAQDDMRPLSDPVGCANPPEITETGATESDAYLAAKQSPLTRSIHPFYRYPN